MSHPGHEVCLGPYNNNNNNNNNAKNDQMCARLGWTCIPLVYGGWGCEAKECYSRLSKRLAMQVGICETEALCQMYCLLAVTLMRQNARAILLRCACAPLLEY